MYVKTWALIGPRPGFVFSAGHGIADTRLLSGSDQSSSFSRFLDGFCVKFACSCKR